MAKISPYRVTYLRKKYAADSDGTALSGFVTEKENKMPRKCGNCKWMHTASCHNPLVMIDPQVKGAAGKPKPVDETSCCNNFQNTP